MRIAQLAPTYERVPPAAYGGTEHIVHLVTEELVRRGHDVTLYATGDSETAARLRSVTPQPVRYGDSTDGLRHAEYLQLANAQACFVDAAKGAFDIVHNHAGVEGLALAATSRTPVLTTNHNPFIAAGPVDLGRLPVGPPRASRGERRDVSEPRRAAADPPRDRRRELPVRGTAGRLPAVPRPLLAGEGRRPGDLPRARAGRRLILAGKVDTRRRGSLRRRRSSPGSTATRSATSARPTTTAKRELLAGADALLFPIDWDEPFGLVMVEALSSGTPVIGLRRASVPEVVEDGVTGFVVDDVDVDGRGDRPDRRDRSAGLPAAGRGALRRRPDGRRLRAPLRDRPGDGDARAR